MTWTQQLADELGRRGVSARRRATILLEIEDHIACEPASEQRLGDPRELAAEFADELGTQAARGAVQWVFGALALTAGALAVSQLAIGSGGGYPGFDNGYSVALAIPAILLMFVAPQVALVAGSLALLRSLRRRRAPILPQAEIDLLRRRAWVGAGAGLACAIGLELYVIDFLAVMHTTWIVLVGALSATAIVAICAAGAHLRATGRVIVGASGPSGDIFDDLPLLGFLRGRPWLLCAIVAGGVGVLMAVAEWHAESSLSEGLQRGAFEGVAAAVGFLALGRAIGARSDDAGGHPVAD
ncbi:MAG TPA: hypothetical protein VHW26_01385 [Solirubrobacteraceae bacterium]|jgi:hypothetical protein|nr:hypothetical protein [Solirubrobacteraceae bacterium]